MKHISGLLCVSIFVLAVLLGLRVHASLLDDQRKLCESRDTPSDRAIESCTAVIVSGQNASKVLARMYIRRAAAHVALGGYDKALTDLNVTLQLLPRHGVILLYRCQVYARARQFDRAITDCTRIVEANPDLLRPLIARAEVYMEKADYTSAIDDYSRAIHLGEIYLSVKRSDRAAALNGRAWAHYKAGTPKNGLGDAALALSLEPNNATILDTRAHLYDALGEKDKAIADYRQALSINPELHETKDALDRLDPPKGIVWYIGTGLSILLMVWWVGSALIQSAQSKR